MRKRVGFSGSILLGAAMITMGLSGNLALAQPVNGNIPGASDTNGCGPSGNQPQKCASVPEPSSFVLLSAALAGLVMWTWKFKKI